MTARSVCLVTLSLYYPKLDPDLGGQVSVTDIYHTIPYQTSTIPISIPYREPPLSLPGR